MPFSDFSTLHGVNPNLKKYISSNASIMSYEYTKLLPLLPNGYQKFHVDNFHD